MTLATILLKDTLLSQDELPILDGGTAFPEVQFQFHCHYIQLYNTYGLGPISNPKGIRYSFQFIFICFNVDPLEILDNMHQVLKDLNCSFTIKHLAALQTVRKILFLGAPNNMEKLEAKTIIDSHLQQFK